MADFTEADAQKLFNQTSKALQENDPVKLSELMQPQPDDVQVTATDEPPVEEPEVKTDSNEEVVAPVEDDKKSETTPPDDKAEKPNEEENKAEPTELDKLRSQLAELERTNHALRSQAGRVPHIQRTIKEYDKKLDELEKKLSSPSSQPSTELQAKLQQVLKGVEGADAELAKAIADAVLAATETVSKDSITKEIETVKFLRSQEVQTNHDAEINRLLEMYPNAPEVFKSDDWKKWKTEQPTDIRRLAESDSADGVALAFDLYAKAMLTKYPNLNKEEDKTKSEETPLVKDEAADRAKQVEAERQRKKATAVTVANPTASGKVDLPDDPQALFTKFAEQIRKEISG